MALGQKRIDPVTGEPEIEIEGGAWTTDWAALRGDAVTSIIRQRLGVFDAGGANIVGGGTVFDTGLDFTKADRIEFSVGDTGSPGRPWPVAQFDAKELISEREGYVWSIGTAWLTLYLDAAGDEAIGRVRVESSGRSSKVNAVSTWADAVIGVGGMEGDADTKVVLITGTLGPGAGGTVNVPLANDGKALFDVAMKLSNGTSFSPPLDTDDGVNRWWYDFDHTTGVITASRFGAFTGGAYRIVAYYA